MFSTRILGGLLTGTPYKQLRNHRGEEILSDYLLLVSPGTPAKLREEKLEHSEFTSTADRVKRKEIEQN